MLTRHAQIQAIASVLAGLDSPLSEDEFTEPYRTCYRVVKTADSPVHALTIALDKYPGGQAILDAILRTPPGGGRNFPSLAGLSASLPPVRWLWPGWIPRGMLSLLGGEPGAGKSYLALDLARRVIAGEPFPDGTLATEGESNTVIYVDAENVPQILNERASIWGMDKSLLFPMLPSDNKSMIDLRDDRDRDDLIEMCRELHPALVIVDSLSSVHTKGENSVEDVRDILMFLNAVAGENDTAVLLIHHLRKRNPLVMTDLISIHDFRGSSHIIAMARSVLALSIVRTTPELDRNGPRRLEVIKTNLARYPEPLGVFFRPLEAEGVWLEYGKPPKEYEPSSRTEQCAEWILKTLDEAGAPIKVKELVAKAEREGFARTTLFRARKQLGTLVEDVEGHRNPNNMWRLGQ